MTEISDSSNPFTASDIAEWAALGPRPNRKPATEEEERAAKSRKDLKKRLASQLGWTEKRVENALDGIVRETEQGTKHNWEEIFPRYPTTPDGYVKSFAPDESEEYLPVLKKYGLVVVKALPEKLCDETVQAMVNEANSLQRDCATSAIDLQDSTTWDNNNWPSGTKFLFDHPTACPAAWKVRLHPNMQKIFTEIYRTKNLVSSVDKWLVARGTRNIVQRNPETGERETRERVLEWEQSLPLHVHLDPWRHRQEQLKHHGGGEYVRSFMAVVALVDCPQEVGGHLTVPGSAPFLDDWAAENLDKKPKKTAFSYYIHNKEKLLRKYKQLIPLRKGEMVVWDMNQFHGTFANTASAPRVGQFVRYIPSEDWFQKLDRFSPRSVYERWPELRKQTEKSLNELGCTQEEKRLAGLCRREE